MAKGNESQTYPPPSFGVFFLARQRMLWQSSTSRDFSLSPVSLETHGSCGEPREVPTTFQELQMG